jgi:hypothetical protein
MSETCNICSGAIPDGEQMGGHTALCAGVVSLRLGDALRVLREVVNAHEGYVMSSFSEKGYAHFETALNAARKVLGDPSFVAPVLKVDE